MSSRALLRQTDYTIKVDLKSRRSRHDVADLDAQVRELEMALTKIAPLLVDRLVDVESRSFGQLVELMLGDHRPTPVDISKARMKTSALRAVFEGTEWLTAAQVGELAGLGQANRSGAANRWKQKRKLFALVHAGQDHYPRYLLDESFRPLPRVEDVLHELKGFSPSRLASWFESRTGLLGGKRPREVFASDPERVVEAARRTVDAELYAS